MECKAREIKKGISRETTLKQDLKHEKELILGRAGEKSIRRRRSNTMCKYPVRRNTGTKKKINMADTR